MRPQGRRSAAYHLGVTIDPITFNADAATRPWVIETVPPLATAPVQAAAIGPLASGLDPVLLRWTGADAISGIARFELSQSTDGRAFTSVSTGLTTSSVIRNLAPGHTYRFRLRGIDRAGNVGAWMAGRAFTLRAISQSSAAVRYRGTWTTARSTTWWGGTARSSSTRGSTASYTFTGRSIAWVGLKSSNRGKAQIYVNGVLKSTIDLYSATTLKQRIVWSANYATSATRTLTIKVLGTTGRPRVDIDGFIVGS